jgi:hypothetical protein
VKALLDAGADVNARAPDGSAALHRASREGHAPVAAARLAHGADPNATDGAGWTPLHQVAGGPAGSGTGEGRATIVLALLMKGASATARAGGPSGPMPLEVAIRFLRPGLADMLRRTGAKG